MADGFISNSIITPPTITSIESPIQKAMQAISEYHSSKIL
jgi:hypothetical protein